MFGPQLASRVLRARKPTTSPSTSAAAPEAPSRPNSSSISARRARRILVAPGRARLDEPLSAVPLGEQHSRAVEVLGGERDDGRASGHGGH